MAEAPDAHARRERPPIVQLRDTTVVYPGGHVGLDRVSLSIGRGEFVFVVGSTGCGKSTLIKLLIREIEPAGGRVLVAGKDINEMSRRQVPMLRRRIGTVFQDFKLLPNRTVYDNVAYALQVTGTGRSEIKRQVPEMVKLGHLDGFQKVEPSLHHIFLAMVGADAPNEHEEAGATS